MRACLWCWRGWFGPSLTSARRLGAPARSAGRDAAIDHEHMARDETCRRRKQEAYDAGDLVRLAEASQWYRGDHACMPFIIGARDCGHRRGDGPRRDRVDPDAIGRELKCQRLGQAVEACLRGSIGCGAGVPDQSDLA